MKRFSICIMLLSLALQAFADKKDGYREEWSGRQLDDGTTMAFVFDYSNTVFTGYCYEDYLLLDPGFQQEIKEAEGRYIKTFFGDGEGISSFKRRKISPRMDPSQADYIVVISPKSFKEDGDFTGEMKLIDKDKNVIALFHNIYAQGGRVGSLANLIGDAYEHHARSMSIIFKEAMKKGKL